MLWECTMLNRLYKSNDFGRIKPRMHNDKIIYVKTESNKFASNLTKVQKAETAISQNLILEYFDINVSEVGSLIKMYNNFAETDQDK